MVEKLCSSCLPTGKCDLKRKAETVIKDFPPKKFQTVTGNELGPISPRQRAIADLKIEVVSARVLRGCPNADQTMQGLKVLQKH